MISYCTLTYRPYVTALQAQLAEKKSISSEDERWLDHEANLVDEQRVLEALEDASDYEQGFARLDGEQKGIVRKLQEAAGDLSKAVGKKRKRASIFLLFVAKLWLTNHRPRTRTQRTKQEKGQPCASFHQEGEHDTSSVHQNPGLVSCQW